MEDFYKLCKQKQDGKISITWQEICDIFSTKYNIKSAEHARDKWKKYRKRIGLLGESNLTRILVLSDLHIPFQLDNLLDILSTYQNKVDVLLFNGDEEDCFSISKFKKKYRIPFVEELIKTRELFIDIINIIKPKKVIFNDGNHNKRFISYMSDNLNDDLLDLMPETNLELLIEDGFYRKDRKNGTKTFFEPLSKIISNIDLVYTHNWYNQIGDVIFCHPSAYKNAVLKTVQDSYLYFLQKGYQFNCLVCSHTHQSGIYKYGNCFIIENGALCKEMDYMKEGKLGRPQSNGMFYCVLENGKFNYDKSKLIIL